MEDFLRILAGPGQVVEVRILDTPKGTVAGYFNDWNKLAEAVKPFDGKANIYVTLNPVNTALLARANNRLVHRPKNTTGDNDITARRWFLVDLDPVRPSGICATETEKAAAHERARQVYAYLKRDGWPEPVVCDSGNGYYLLYRVDLPNNNESRELVQACLQALSLRFDDSKVSIDTSVFNAARIIRLIGTVNAKGDSTEDRPHRRSKLLRVPETLEPVPVEKLRELAALAPKPEPRPAPLNGSAFDLERWIAERGLPVVSSGPWQGGRRWILNPCPMNPEHTNKSAYIVQFADGRIAAGCHHNSCQWWGWRELREKYEPGCYDRPTRREDKTGNGESEEGLNSLNSFNSYSSYPESPAPDAFYGLPGDVVRAIDPHTEADPVAVLVQVLIAFGNAIGRTAYFVAEADKHYLNEFAVLVGSSAKGRKGSSFGHVRRLFRMVDPEWEEKRIQFGLSSGEGLIWAVRDPIEKTEPVYEGKGRDKQIVGYETNIIDPGVEDKRLLVYEAEFASTLRVLQREGNTLSATIRNAWDYGRLQSLVKNNPAKATDAHISIIGHITKDELLRYLDTTEAGNGFGNRFLWLCVRRSKVLPEGGNLRDEDLYPLAERLRQAVEFAKTVGEMKRDETARRLWWEVYAELSEGKPGLLGAMIARAEAHVMRLACIYALLDFSAVIREEHLRAALALWDYCERSARFIFGDALGDPVADEILRMLREAAPEGLTRTEISNAFGRNKPAERIAKSLGALAANGLVYSKKEEPEEGKGRPREVWFATVKKILPYEKNELNEKSLPPDGLNSLNSFNSYPNSVFKNRRQPDPGGQPTTPEGDFIETEDPTPEPERPAGGKAVDTLTGEPDPLFDPDEWEDDVE